MRFLLPLLQADSTLSWLKWETDDSDSICEFVIESCSKELGVCNNFSIRSELGIPVGSVNELVEIFSS